MLGDRLACALQLAGRIRSSACQCCRHGHASSRGCFSRKALSASAQLAKAVSEPAGSLSEQF
eukprot:1071774-Amphidinium_carterae.1